METLGRSVDMCLNVLHEENKKAARHFGYRHPHLCIVFYHYDFMNMLLCF
jgi:hypothetical protein